MEHKPSVKTQDSLLLQFKTLVDVVAKLRGPNGCPWDKEQTQRTLTRYAIEEAHELVEAIESGDQKEIREELGDFLFQVILQAQVAEDEGQFDLQQVIEVLNEKMIRRHPHVFSNVVAKTTDEVWKNWEKLKKQEKEKPVFSYPRTLPALQAADKIGSKSKNYRFDWTRPDEVLEKIKEELREVEEALREDDPKHLEHEIGDLLFSVAQLARHKNLAPEQCLRVANRRFENRFNQVLTLAEKLHGADAKTPEGFSQIPAVEKESLWAQAKKILG